MGNCSVKQSNFIESRNHQADTKFSIPLNVTLDGGFLTTHDLYQTPQDYKYIIIHQLMFEGKMAPFYRGLSEFDPLWPNKKLIHVVRQHLFLPFKDTLPLYTRKFPGGFYLEYISKVLKSNTNKSYQPYTFRFRSIISLFRHLLSIHKFFIPPLELSLYRNSQECLICFLYYPRINYTRCCSKPICSECFVQIKRTDPHLLYDFDNESKNIPLLISESVSCPFCLEKDFGIVYLSSQKHNYKPFIVSSVTNNENSCSFYQKYPSTHPSVVTSDMIRPHWFSQLIDAQRKAMQIAVDEALLADLMTLDNQSELLKPKEKDCHKYVDSMKDDSKLTQLEENNKDKQTALHTTKNIVSRNIIRLNLKNTTYANYVTAIRERELAAGKGFNRPIITLYDGTTVAL